MTQGSKRTYSGVLDCARKIGQQEGYATFLQARLCAKLPIVTPRAQLTPALLQKLQVVTPHAQLTPALLPGLVLLYIFSLPLVRFLCFASHSL